MKKILSMLPFAILLLTACKTSVKGKNGVEYKTAIQYNDYIVERQTVVANMIMDFAKESSVDLNKAEGIIDNAIKKVDGSITDLEGMPEWKGNTEMRDKAITLFKFYKDIFSSDYKKVINMQKDGEMSDAEQAEYATISEGVTNRETKLDAEFKTAQTAFASKNGFTIGTNNIQKKIDDMK